MAGIQQGTASSLILTAANELRDVHSHFRDQLRHRKAKQLPQSEKGQSQGSPPRRVVRQFRRAQDRARPAVGDRERPKERGGRKEGPVLDREGAMIEA